MFTLAAGVGWWGAAADRFIHEAWVGWGAADGSTTVPDTGRVAAWWCFRKSAAWCLDAAATAWCLMAVAAAEAVLAPWCADAWWRDAAMVVR